MSDVGLRLDDDECALGRASGMYCNMPSSILRSESGRVASVSLTGPLPLGAIGAPLGAVAAVGALASSVSVPDVLGTADVTGNAPAVGKARLADAALVRAAVTDSDFAAVEAVPGTVAVAVVAFASAVRLTVSLPIFAVDSCEIVVDGS